MFFNRPIELQAGTCYTIEVLEASSRSKTIYVSGGSSMSMSSSSGQNDIKYCGGCHMEEITRKDSKYWGYISHYCIQTQGFSCIIRIMLQKNRGDFASTTQLKRHGQVSQKGPLYTS